MMVQRGRSSPYVRQIGGVEASGASGTQSGRQRASETCCSPAQRGGAYPEAPERLRRGRCLTPVRLLSRGSLAGASLCAPGLDVPRPSPVVLRAVSRPCQVPVASHLEQPRLSQPQAFHLRAGGRQWEGRCTEGKYGLDFWYPSTYD